MENSPDKGTLIPPAAALPHTLVLDLCLFSVQELPFQEFRSIEAFHDTTPME
jgi:hypothetical protein